ncbi:hypothetical protein BH10ACI1_BH10ACI1_18320 [soil metagenome]
MKISKLTIKGFLKKSTFSLIRLWTKSVLTRSVF